MTWYSKIYDGELMGRFWELTLLTEERYMENSFLKDLLKRGSVLDVGCGPGSHTAYLSKKQYVVGIDLSKYLISRAKEECKNRGNYKNVDLIRVDMGRYLPFQSNTFDNVINVLSFGFSSDEQNERFFAENVRVLKKHGLYIYQGYNHPKKTLALEWETTNPKAPKGFFIMKKRKYNPKTKRVHIKETIKDTLSGEKANFDFENRIYTVSELKKLHKTNGLKIKYLLGSLEVEGLDWEVREFDEKKFGLMTIISERT